MKKKLHISFFIFMFSILNIYAQSDYNYYYKGQKVYLTLDKTNITLSTFDDFQKSSISSLNLKDFNIEVENTTGQKNKYANVEFQNLPTDLEYFQKINTLNSNPKIIKAQPNFINQLGVKIGMSDYFYVKLKNSNDLSLLQNLAVQKNIQIIEQNQFMPLWFTLKCKKNSKGSTLEIANFFFETGNFASAVPDFLSDDLHSNDTLYPNQWGLNNVGQSNGINGIDIKVNNAWNITQGSGIKIAVLDQGIDKTHPDLMANLSPLSFDTESGTVPSQVLGNHGTACAGIIGAIKDNNVGVTGVSPLSKLIDVSNSLGGTPNSRIKRADGINWAWQNGADIISNSWGSSVQYQAIDDAIENALTNGRNGKGTIIVFSSGNNNGEVEYPGNINDKIICVGAISQCGQRKNPSSCDGETNWGSNYGAKLDVVAPGVKISTTDRQGILGYNPTNETNPNYSNQLDYFSSFNGTSSACPYVAGVAALVLSTNPCLSEKQVRDIIEQTSQKVGGYSYVTTAGRPNGLWNNQMGYGLIDAYAAVLMAQSMGFNTQISGNSIICNSETYTAPVGGSSYNWTITQGANLVTLTANGTANITLTALPNSSGEVALSLIMGNSCGNATVTKTIWVGKPNINLPTDCWNLIPTTPNCFSICRQIEMTTSNYIFVEGQGLDATSNQSDSWEWQKITNNFDLSPNGNSAYINPMWYVAPQNYLGYRVRVKNACGWSDWFENYLEIIDCSNGGGQNLYSIFPNPSKDIVNIELSDSKNQPEKGAKISGTLFDLIGQTKSKVQITDNKATFSVQGLNKGVYVLKIYINDQVETHQMIIE